MTLLVVDDEEKVCKSIQRLFRDKDFEVIMASNGKEGLIKLKEISPKAIITDYKMPQMTGLEFIKAAKTLYPDIPVIVLTAFGDKETSVKFLKEGAFQYLEKPFELDELKITVEKAMEKHQLIEENKKLNDLLALQKEKEIIIGESRVMQETYYLAQQVAKTDATVLLQGESGTGKNLIARVIHEHSLLKDKPFIQFNCAAFNESLIESELFGYEKGAFTGADQTKMGRFDIAKDGTIFLDEIGELSLNMQVKLLRVLQEQEYERVGGTTTLKTEARILAATNQNLEEMVAQKQFREDLFFRLNVFPITTPPLRKRKEDIPLLAHHFLQEISKKFNKPIKGFSEKTMDLIQNHIWKGNVRDLKNAISRAVIICQGEVITEDNLDIKKESAAINFIKKMAESNYTEQELVKIYAKKIFEKCNFNKKETLKVLNINFRTLNSRLS